ncbi:hypothetical protein K435DRAFT_919437 [Dendrothele bispora CBS 962.96]|uniref:WW domain-containing protein n=1 Tax=Dendrothele bispora (strain CBS 962.96) TaxID=1314807 RepID=A0A4S8LFB0_DENBC|nr:hypothetical protein K435DRAFT_919437 [Dendrothele bispora CBS 962.96]
MSQPDAISSSKTKHTKGWNHYIHPNGWKYFYHPELHIVTSLDVTEIPDNFKFEPSPGSEYDVVLQDTQGSQKFFVNHVRKYASFELRDIQGDAKQDDKVDELHIAYWDFMRRFPAHRSLPKGDGPDGSPSDSDAFQSALQVLNHPDLLRKRESDSEVPFSLIQCNQILEYLNTYKEPSKNTFPGVPSQSVALTALISWILWTADAWTTFLSTLSQELSVSNLGAAVLLSSSTAFLAVPGIDKVPRIVTLISIIITLGSVMTGLYLQWQIGKIRFKDVKIQPTALAIIFSVPFAALIWGIILFTVSVITFSILGMVDLDSGSEQGGQSTTFENSTWISVLAEFSSLSSGWLVTNIAIVSET